VGEWGPWIPIVPLSSIVLSKDWPIQRFGLSEDWPIQRFGLSIDPVGLSKD